MAAWQLQHAKAQFSEVANRAQTEGPQIVTKRGVEYAVVLSAEEYAELCGKKKTFMEHLLSAPKVEGFAEILDEIREESRSGASREANARRQAELDQMFEEV